MHINVLFFGVLKDIVGRPEDELDVPPGSALGSVFDHYAKRFPRLGEMAGSIVLARNREFAALAAPVLDGDEVAFLPPVSGGSAPRPVCEIAEAGHYFALTRRTI